MTIEIVSAEFQEDADLGISSWACLLEITQAAEAYLLPANAPGTLDEGELQAYFDAKEADLFTLAQAKGVVADEIYNRLPDRILKAFALVVLDEVNLLRSQHGLAPRTTEQLRTAVKNKLKS